MSSSSRAQTHGRAAKRSLLRPFTYLITTLAMPVVFAFLFYKLDPLDPAPYPAHELTRRKSTAAPERNADMLTGSEKIGDGQLQGPEDMAYDPKSRVIYTGCRDGWIKRVTVNESAGDSVVEDWVNTGGRPLGVVCGSHGEVIVADAIKGLLKVRYDGNIEILTDEAEGVKFKLVNGVDVAKNGIIYFTDTSYKYDILEYANDAYEGRPHGRLLSYDPKTCYKVLVRDLFFPNGVAVSPDQESLIFCETMLSKCKRFYISGEKTGSLEKFVDTPGVPDNIRYDGEGQYWIALVAENTYIWELALKYPFIRKVKVILEKTIGRRVNNGGAFSVDLEGNPTSHYHAALTPISSVVKIEDYLYCGSLSRSYLFRLNIKQHPAIITM